MTRVIGARELEQLAVGASFEVPADAIITPLAKDIIREKRLRLEQVEAEADIASRKRAAELDEAEQVLDVALEPSAPTVGKDDEAAEPGEIVQDGLADETQIALIVEATVKHVLSQTLLDKVEAPDVIKFAVFGADGVALLRAVTEEVQRCGAKIERLSGRTVANVFVLAVAVASPPSKRDETRKTLQEGLLRRKAPVVFKD